MPQTTDVGPTGLQLSELASQFAWDGNALEPGMRCRCQAAATAPCFFTPGR